MLAGKILVENQQGWDGCTPPLWPRQQEDGLWNAMDVGLCDIGVLGISYGCVGTESWAVKCNPCLIWNRFPYPWNRFQLFWNFSKMIILCWRRCAMVSGAVEDVISTGFQWNTE